MRSRLAAVRAESESVTKGGMARKRTLTSDHHRATMILMLRWFVILTTLVSIAPRAAAGQAASVLHIKIVLLDAERKPFPVPRHALLISDNPATAPPRLVT